MPAASRRALLYWVLLLLPTLAVGVGAILLLRREQARLAEQTSGAVEARRAAIAARARLVAENVELLVGDAQNALLDTLAAVPSAGLDRFLDEWERSTPLVRVTFRSRPDGSLLRPTAAAAGAEASAFVRRYTRQFSGSPPWAPARVEKAEKDAGMRTEELEERKAVASNVGQLQQARRDVQELSRQQAAPLADSARVRSASAPAAAGASADARAESAVAADFAAGASAPGRRGWTPYSLDGRLYQVGWVEIPELGEFRGVEMEMLGLIGRLAGALPAEASASEGFALRDAQGQAIHQVGMIPTGAAPLITVPLAASMLPGWEAVAYLQAPYAASGGGRGLFVAGTVLVAGFVAVIIAFGSLMLRQAQQSEADAALKTSFVANVSHEFKTPLTTIRLYSELLEQGRVGNPEKERDYLRTIGRETQRLARLVNNVLDFSRLEQGRKRYERVQMDLVAEIARLVATQSHRMSEAGIEVQTDFPRSLPIVTDRDAVQQVVLNLLDNAAKYAAAGGQLLVAIARTPAGGATVRVCDRGRGVPPEHLERIFEKFHRVDESLTSDRAGAGLGLSIARQLARGLGGDLRCEPRAGGGAVFVLELP